MTRNYCSFKKKTLCLSCFSSGECESLKQQQRGAFINSLCWEPRTDYVTLHVARPLRLVKSYGLLTITNNSSITIGTVRCTPTAVGARSQGILTAMAADVFEPYTGGASGNCVFIDLLSTAVANHTTDNKCIVKIPAIKTNCTPGPLVVNFHTASMWSVCSLYNSDWFGWTTCWQKQNCASLLKKTLKSMRQQMLWISVIKSLINPELV